MGINEVPQCGHLVIFVALERATRTVRRRRHGRWT
jgi:hypothetical protein